MKSSDKAILAGLGVIALIAAFWIVVLGPKRSESSDLTSQIDTLSSQVAQSEQEAAAGQQAQTDFSHNYRRLVAIGKAVPADADTPSLLTDLQTRSQRSNVSFRSIELTSSGDSSSLAAPSAATDPAAASEAAAALLPIGATVGNAGLPVMPYSLEFQGGFFDVADFFGELDSTVHIDKDDQARVKGRLLTIDGFSLQASPKGFPDLTANVAVTSYLAPDDQGITAGATPTGPELPTEVPAGEAAPPESPAAPAAVGAN